MRSRSARLLLYLGMPQLTRRKLRMFMTFPVRITWKNHDPSPGMDDYIREQALRLERFSEEITDSHITIETPHRHQSHGRQFHVVLDVRVPGKEFVASRDPKDGGGHEDLNATIRDAFDAVKSQLSHYFERKRDTTRHPSV